MRRQTLAGICVFVSIAVGLGLWWAVPSLPLGLPPVAVGVILAPVLVVLLTPLNNRLMKARGRDFEIEELHENEEAGVISLRPREKNPEDSYRYYDKYR